MYACFCLIRLPHTELTRNQTLCQLSQCGVRLHVNRVNAEWDSTSTESTRRHQHLRRFYHSALTQLMWGLTLRWLSWRGVSFGVDSVDEEWDSASTEAPTNVSKNWISQQNQKQNKKNSEALLFWRRQASFSHIHAVFPPWGPVLYGTIPYTVRYDTNTVRYDTRYHMVFLPTFSHGIFPSSFHIHSDVWLSLASSLSLDFTHGERYTTTPLPLG